MIHPAACPACGFAATFWALFWADVTLGEVVCLSCFRWATRIREKLLFHSRNPHFKGALS